MYPRTVKRITKIGLIPVLLMILSGSCQNNLNLSPVINTIRFEKLLFGVPSPTVADSIRLLHTDIMPFFNVFNEEIIRIGPDTLPGYPAELEKFKQDPVIKSVYADIDDAWKLFSPQIRTVEKGMNQMAKITGTPEPVLITYLSGFNESFITLPGILGIGLDKYMGADYRYYQELRMPAYLRASMNPENLAPDAIKAWVISEMPPLPPGGSFLDQLIFQGKVHYIMRQLVPEVPENLLFHFSAGQIKWCRDNEKAMWKFLAGERIIFSTDRMTIRKYLDEAPFTKDFGEESPGKAACWIGYRILQSYMKNSKSDIPGLFAPSESQAVLAASRYRP